MDSLDEAKFDIAITSPPWGQLGRAFTLGMVSGLGKLLLQVLNTTTVNNHQTWLQTVMHRDPGVGLITICNHTSMFDDPGIFSAITPWSYFLSEPQHHGMRWSMCAREVCFKNELLRQFFQNGKVLPITRGAGVEQPVMKTVAREVAQGGWLHVFPEGRIMMTGAMGPFRWGVGKVVCDAKQAAGGRDPIILPFFHSNMGAVLPVDSTIPRAGNQVTVTIGQPLDVSGITCRCNQAGQDQQQVWQDITVRMYEAMKQLEASSPQNPYQRENPVGKPGLEVLRDETSDPRLANRA